MCIRDRPHAVLWLSYTLVHDDLKIVKHALLTPFIREACKKIPYVNTLVVQAHRHRPDYTSVANYPMIVSGVLPADRCPSSTQDDPFFYCGCGPGRSSCWHRAPVGLAHWYAALNIMGEFSPTYLNKLFRISSLFSRDLSDGMLQ